MLKVWEVIQPNKALNYKELCLFHLFLFLTLNLESWFKPLYILDSATFCNVRVQ